MATKPDDVFALLEQLDGAPSETLAHVRNRTRGLPDESARRELAETFLKHQHRLWPELVKIGVLPKRSREVVTSMSESFRKAFETGEWTPYTHTHGKKRLEPIGMAYLRYSDANSNTRSPGSAHRLSRSPGCPRRRRRS